MRQQYYRGKFMIGIYALEHEGETCLAICENVKDFAKIMHIKETCARTMLHNAYKGVHKYVKFANRLRLLQFIDMLDD